MMPTRTDPADVHALAAFSDALARDVVALNVSVDRPDAFAGHVDARIRGHIRVADIRAGSCVTERTPALIDEHPVVLLQFVLVERGEVRIAQADRSIMLRAGDMTYLDSDAPYSIAFAADAHVVMVLFPKEHMTVPPEMLGRQSAVRIVKDAGIPAVTKHYLSSLSTQFEALDERGTYRLFWTAADLVDNLLESILSSTPGLPPNERLLWQMLEYIEVRLPDPALSPSMIAAAHHVSLRHLHNIFTAHGLNVGRLIRNWRMDLCFRELASPRTSASSVTTIALHNGFVDGAHFSRSFRARYGVSPGSLR